MGDKKSFIFACIVFVLITLSGISINPETHWFTFNNVKAVEKSKSEMNSQMIYVQGGTFQMGDTFGDGYNYERPVHQVNIRSFSIGKYPVTFAEYDAFCDATGRAKPSDQGWGRGDRPVINVTWYDAVEYCNWRSKKDGLKPAYISKGLNVSCDFDASGYRLPTEAEWEYAAKGGKHSKEYKYSGSNEIDVVAWYIDNSGDMTHPVGQKQPNELGIYDMSGNVYNWCWDWYDVAYYQYSDTNNPIGPQSGGFRVARGGCYGDKIKNVRSVVRFCVPPFVPGPILGFRLVCK